MSTIHEKHTYILTYIQEGTKVPEIDMSMSIIHESVRRSKMNSAASESSLSLLFKVDAVIEKLKSKKTFPPHKIEGVVLCVMYVYMWMYVCAYMYVYVYMHIYSHIHIRMYCTCVSMPRLSLYIYEDT